MLTTCKITLSRAKTRILSVNIELKLHLQKVNTHTDQKKKKSRFLSKEVNAVQLFWLLFPRQQYDLAEVLTKIFQLLKLYSLTRLLKKKKGGEINNTTPWHFGIVSCLSHCLSVLSDTSRFFTIIFSAASSPVPSPSSHSYISLF